MEKSMYAPLILLWCFVALQITFFMMARASEKTDPFDNGYDYVSETTTWLWICFGIASLLAFLVGLYAIWHSGAAVVAG